MQASPPVEKKAKVPKSPRKKRKRPRAEIGASQEDQDQVDVADTATEAPAEELGDWRIYENVTCVRRKTTSFWKTAFPPPPSSSSGELLEETPPEDLRKSMMEDTPWCLRWGTRNALLTGGCRFLAARDAAKEKPKFLGRTLCVGWASELNKYIHLWIYTYIYIYI